MNPILTVGPFSLAVFSSLILLAAGIGLALLAAAARRRGERSLAWVDAGLGALIAGVVGARLVHVALHWDYFAARLPEITDLQAGGLDWHGAALGGLIGAALVARWRGVTWGPLSDVLALAWPVGVILGALACGAAACGYGAEVWTLADFPAWAVSERPDVYGFVAPRYNTQDFAAALGLGLLALMILLAWRGGPSGYRLWLALGLSAAGLFVIGFYRGDRAVSLLPNLSPDQALDGLLIALCAGGTAATGWAARRKRLQSETPQP